VISILTGEVGELGSDTVVLSVSGIGYEIRLAPRLLSALRVGDITTFYIRMVIREDEVMLFGFKSRTEKEQFDLLCTVSGIGPKLAMTVLSGMDTASFSAAISNQDEQAIRKIPGIGQKIAKLILLTLSGKLQTAIPHGATRVLAALKQLGIEEVVARSALAQIDGTLSESEMLKQALRIIDEGK
jgi:Holliday junction DNA helicase RuvA